MEEKHGSYPAFQFVEALDFRRVIVDRGFPISFLVGRFCLVKDERCLVQGTR
jgi:hypothetical protein